MNREGFRGARSRRRHGLTGPLRRSVLHLRSTWHPRSAVARALRLAEVIQARAATIAQPRSRSPMILLHPLAPPPAAPAAATRLDVNVNIFGEGRGSPMLLRGRGPAGAADAIRSAAPARPIDRALIELARPAAAGAQTRVLDTVRRVVEQHVRVETAARSRSTDLAPVGRRFQPAASGRPASPAAPEWQPSPLRQVVRPAVARAARPEPSAGTGASGSATPYTPAQPTTPPLDVDRLTDQIIQIIDRRIIASRERLGRI